MKSNALVAVVVVVLAAGGVWYMTRPKPAAMPEPTDTTMEKTTGSETPEASGSDMMTDESGVVSITMDASEFKFSKPELTVKKGEKVKLTLTNSGNMPHDWVLDEFAAKTKQIGKGETDTIEFTADKAGTYEYYCSVGRHRQMGMVGKLTVTE